MEAKTLNPDADADADGAPRTLAAGELVWAKPKGRRSSWWPARLLAAWPADAAARDVGVSYFGFTGALPPGPPAQVRPFADPDADRMAQGSAARVFFAAIQEAHASAVAALRAPLTCCCVPPPSSPEAGGVGVAGVAKLSPAEFLAALRDAALNRSPVGLVDRARLKSWVRSFGEGWGPGGAGHYPRRTLEELVDKIDLDIPASDDKEDDYWLAEASERPQETPVPQKKCWALAPIDELGAGEDENKNGSATSRKRERKKSKYLSPPYTDFAVSKRRRKAIDLPKPLMICAAESDTNLAVSKRRRKATDSPKPLMICAAESDSEVLPGGIGVEEVLSLVLGLAKDVSHGSRFRKAAEAFILSFRSTEFKCHEAVSKRRCKATDSPKVLRICAAFKCPETKFNDGRKSPVTRSMTCAIENADVDITSGAVSDSQTVMKQSKRAAKRSKKNDDDGRASSSIKRKKRGKYSPAAAIGCELPITHAVPIRQVKAEDIRSQMKAGGGARVLGARVKDEKFKPSVFKCGISPAITEATEPGQEQATFSDQPAKESDEAKLNDEKNEPLLFKFGDVKSEPLVFKCSISAAVSGAIMPGQEQVHGSGVSVVTAPQVAENTLSNQSAKENYEAIAVVTKSETNVESMLVDAPSRIVQMEATGSEGKISTDESMQSVVADLPLANVSREAPESKANVCIDETVQSIGAGVPLLSVGANVPVQGVGADDVPVQGVGADVHVNSGPSTVNGDIAQAVDENKEHSSVEMHTVHQSYASLQAMVPEMLKKVTNINATDVIPVNHALKDGPQKDEQPSQKVKLTVGSMANHPDKPVNGTGPPDATNSTLKKKKKKPTQLFVNPAEIIVEFERGVMMPSREELLAAFCKFGFVIESQTNIAEDTRSARVVFGNKAEAENAYKRADFLGVFGPPFATVKLGYLPPIELSAPPLPHSRTSSPIPPLTDIRKNLEKMILARHSFLKNATAADGLEPVSDKLLADIQGLLVRVDKIVSGPSTSTPP